VLPEKRSPAAASYAAAFAILVSARCAFKLDDAG
jgi:hypothetical protein